MWNQVKRWFDHTSNATELGQRLFSIFDADQASREALFQQIESDLKAWGYDSFQSRQAAKRITEKATEIGAANTDAKGAETRVAAAIQTNDGDLLEHLAAERGDGVTSEDIRWYWTLHNITRTAMRLFDEELRGRMWMDRHAYHLCMEDLDQDIKRQLPVFGDPISHDRDSPLPPELKRRFASFITRTKREQASFNEWSTRLQQASSMNALIRELIRSGDF